MRIETFYLILLFVCASYAQKPKTPAKNDKSDSRFLTSISFLTFNIAKTRTTTTSTFTSTVTCTTSTATLTTCTAGRRRRGLFYSEGEPRNQRGLLYNDQDPDSIYTNRIVKRSDNPVDEVKPKPAKKDGSELIPLEVEPGFTLPEGAPGNRFLLSFGTSTVTSITVTTTTTSLTAVCSSTTGFPTC